MRNTVLDYIDSVSSYANKAISAVTEFLRSNPPDLQDISSISATVLNDRPWIDVHCESEFSFDLNTKLVSEWLNDIDWEKTEQPNYFRNIWRTDAFTFVLWFWRKK